MLISCFKRIRTNSSRKTNLKNQQKTSDWVAKIEIKYWKYNWTAKINLLLLVGLPKFFYQRMLDVQASNYYVNFY